MEKWWRFRRISYPEDQRKKWKGAWYMDQSIDDKDGTAEVMMGEFKNHDYDKSGKLKKKVLLKEVLVSGCLSQISMRISRVISISNSKNQKSVQRLKSNKNLKAGLISSSMHIASESSSMVTSGKHHTKRGKNTTTKSTPFVVRWLQLLLSKNSLKENDQQGAMMRWFDW